MAQVITKEDGLQMLKRAFPEAKNLFNANPALCTVFTGCEKAIPFCLVSNVNGRFYVREIISGRSYQTSNLIYREMDVGETYSNMTVINQNGNSVVRMIKKLNA